MIWSLDVHIWQIIFTYKVLCLSLILYLVLQKNLVEKIIEFFENFLRFFFILFSYKKLLNNSY